MSGADVAVQLGHKALAERHNLAVGLALGVEVGAALAAADGQAGQGIFKDLLKAQEFDNAQIHRRMETQAALVGADGAVELHAVAAVDLNFTVVVHPRYAEHNLALRLGNALQNTAPSEYCGFCSITGSKDCQNLGDSLDEFRLAGIFSAERLSRTGR